MLSLRRFVSLYLVVSAQIEERRRRRRRIRFFNL